MASCEGRVDVRAMCPKKGSLFPSLTRWGLTPASLEFDDPFLFKLIYEECLLLIACPPLCGCSKFSSDVASVFDPQQNIYKQEKIVAKFISMMTY